MFLNNSILPLVLPMLRKEASPAPLFKIGAVICGLLIIAVYWLSAAIYHYSVGEIDKTIASGISAGVLLVISGISSYFMGQMAKKRVANTALQIALQEGLPLLLKFSSFFLLRRKKLIFSLIALWMGYSFLNKR